MEPTKCAAAIHRGRDETVTCRKDADHVQRVLAGDGDDEDRWHVGRASFTTHYKWPVRPVHDDVVDLTVEPYPVKRRAYTGPERRAVSRRA